jgi:hypothetical protein
MYCIILLERECSEEKLGNYFEVTTFEVTTFEYPFEVTTFEYLSTEKMIADILTKPLPKCKFVECCRGLGLLDLSSSSRGSVEV